jgi:hypothetical protein
MPNLLEAISKKQIIYNGKTSASISYIKYVIVLKSGVREIFSTTRCRIIAAWAPKRQLPSILLPAGTTFGVPQKDTAAFA